jgi:hypothetical protein
MVTIDRKGIVRTTMAKNVAPLFQWEHDGPLYDLIGVEGDVPGVTMLVYQERAQ